MNTAEVSLREQAKVMQRSILEGTVAGAAAGIGFDLLRNMNSDNKSNVGFRIGSLAGTTSGTYVGYVQKKYLLRERRLGAIKEDLDRNAAEMQTTIAVMRQVVALQKAELDELRDRAATEDAPLAGELQRASDNLTEMQRAIDGAVARQAEFGEARRLTIRRNQTEAPIDPDLAALALQIQTMKDIANDLASSL